MFQPDQLVPAGLLLIGNILAYTVVFDRLRPLKGLPQAVKTLETLSLFDQLTGCVNGNYVEKIALPAALETAFQELDWTAGRDGGTLRITPAFSTFKPVSLLYLDLDGFRAVNNTEGHAAGDRMLHLAGEAIRKPLKRSTDVAARVYRGDEFMVLLPGATGDSADLTAIAIQQELLKIGLSASIGVISTDRLAEAATPTAFIEHAEAMARTAKRAGKGMIWSKHRGGASVRVFPLARATQDA